MAARCGGSIGEVPYLVAGLRPNGVGGRLGAVPPAELREQAADVVFDRLARDVEPVADLRIRQALAEQGEYLGLAFRQRPNALGAGPDGGAQRPEHRRGLVGVTGGLQPLEALECALGL